MDNQLKSKKWNPKGQYVICKEDRTLYSTNSTFWHWFFKNNEKRYEVNK